MTQYGKTRVPDAAVILIRCYRCSPRFGGQKHLGIKMLTDMAGYVGFGS